MQPWNDYPYCIDSRIDRIASVVLTNDDRGSPSTLRNSTFALTRVQCTRTAPSLRRVAELCSAGGYWHSSALSAACNESRDLSPICPQPPCGQGKARDTISSRVRRLAEMAGSGLPIIVKRASTGNNSRTLTKHRRLSRISIIGEWSADQKPQ